MLWIGFMSMIASVVASNTTTASTTNSTDIIDRTNIKFLSQEISNLKDKQLFNYIAEDVTLRYTTDTTGVVNRRNAEGVNQTYIDNLMSQARVEILESVIETTTIV